MAECSSNRKYLFLLGACLVCLGMLFLYGTIDYTVYPFSHWDLRSYRRMARAAPHLAEDVPRPFAYRILGPYVVGLLPMSESLGFRLLTLVVGFSLIPLFYFLLCERGVSACPAACAVALFVWNKQLFGFAVWNFFQVNDTLSLLCLVLLFWVLWRERWVAFAIVLFLGAFTRETALLMVPTAFVYLLERGRWQEKGRALLLAVIPGVAAFLFLRWLIQPAAGRGLLDAFLLHADKVTSVETWFRLLINPFIPLSLIPLVFVEQTVSFVRQNKHMALFFLLVLAGTLFGGNNERLMAPAFVVFYLLIAEILQGEFQGAKGMLAVILVCGFLSSLHHRTARFPLSQRYLTVILSMGSLGIVTAVGVLVRLRNKDLKREGKLRELAR